MRRKDKEMTDIQEKMDVIGKCKVCRIGLSDNDIPYVIPLNYGYSFENEVLTLFFHSALEGRKMEIIKRNNRACFEMDCDTKPVEADSPCKFGYEFRSVIGFGTITVLDSPDEKAYGLNLIMKHQTGKDTVYDFTEKQLEKVCVYQLVVETFTGKRKKQIP